MLSSTFRLTLTLFFLLKPKKFEFTKFNIIDFIHYFRYEE